MQVEKNTSTVQEVPVGNDAQNRDSSRPHKFSFHRSRPKHILPLFFLISFVVVVLLAFSFGSNVIHYLIAPNVIIISVFLMEKRNREIHSNLIKP